MTETDCRSAVGETVQLVDSAILLLRLAARADLSSPAVREALQDLASDPEVASVIQHALELVACPGT